MWMMWCLLLLLFFRANFLLLMKMNGRRLGAGECQVTFCRATSRAKKLRQISLCIRHKWISFRPLRLETIDDRSIDAIWRTRYRPSVLRPACACAWELPLYYKHSTPSLDMAHGVYIDYRWVDTILFRSPLIPKEIHNQDVSQSKMETRRSVWIPEETN